MAQAGTEAIAALAVVFPLIMLAAMLSGGAFGGAISGATARALGAKDPALATSVLCAAVVIALAGGILMALLALQFGPALYLWAAQSGRIVAAASIYANIVFPAIPLFWLVNCLNSVLRGSGDLRTPAEVSAVMLISYVAFAWLLIPRHQEDVFHSMQMAAWAVVLSYICALLYSLWAILRQSQTIRFARNGLQLKVITALIRQGSLAGSQSIMTITYAMVCTAIFSRFGAEWLAGYGLAVRLEIIMMPVIFGIGATLIPIAGAHIGAGLRQRAIAITWRGIAVNAVLVGSIGVLLGWQPQWWCSPLTSTARVEDHCQQALSIIGPTYGLFAVGLTCYIASQAFNTLFYPVFGALLRLLIVASCLFWVTPETDPVLVLWTIASAVCIYGIFIAGGLWSSPWSTRE